MRFVSIYAHLLSFADFWINDGKDGAMKYDEGAGGVVPASGNEYASLFSGGIL